MSNRTDLPADVQRDLRRYAGLINIRRGLTGQKAAATQRKLEALVASLKARGASYEDLDQALQGR